MKLKFEQIAKTILFMGWIQFMVPVYNKCLFIKTRERKRLIQYDDAHFPCEPRYQTMQLKLQQCLSKKVHFYTFVKIVIMLLQYKTVSEKLASSSTVSQCCQY